MIQYLWVSGGGWASHSGVVNVYLLRRNDFGKDHAFQLNAICGHHFRILNPYEKGCLCACSTYSNSAAMQKNAVDVKWMRSSKLQNSPQLLL